MIAVCLCYDCTTVSFIHFKYFYFLCTRVLSACMCVCQILETQGPMKLELQMVVRCQVSAGNQIQVVWKSKCSYLPSLPDSTRYV